MIKGGKNTFYFHHYASHRHRCNFKNQNERGDFVTAQLNLVKVTKGFFSSLFITATIVVDYDQIFQDCFFPHNYLMQI